MIPHFFNNVQVQVLRIHRSKTLTPWKQAVKVLGETQASFFQEQLTIATARLIRIFIYDLYISKIKNKNECFKKKTPT